MLYRKQKNIYKKYQFNTFLIKKCHTLIQYKHQVRSALFFFRINYLLSCLFVSVFVIAIFTQHSKYDDNTATIN